ncbi:MAG: lysophospholipid acyltransferase family protein [Gammaproteobacteria bacterium]
MAQRFTPYRSVIFPLRLWVEFFAFFIPASLLVTILPGRERRRRVARSAGRLFFRLGGITLAVSGLDQLPEGGCFVISNHASYLDGPLLTAALPPRFGFVIKREAMQTPIIGWMLRRLGSEFVERLDTKAAWGHANRLIRLARAGSSLGVFPEGTFEAEPGLRSFHLGAFLAATRAGIPVVPLVIRGSREILPGETRWPRPGKIEIEVLAPIMPRGRLLDDALALRDAVRLRMLEHSSEAERANAKPQRAARKRAA